MLDNKIIATSKLIVIASLLGLIISLTVANWMSNSLNLTRWVIQILPLLAFVPALRGDRLRPFQWLCFVIMLYFMLGVLMAFSLEQQLIGIVITFFCALLFCSAIFYVHQQQKAHNRES